MQWYYAVKGQQTGPVDESVLQGLARDGTLKPADLVWNQTMGNQWAKAETVPGLFAAGSLTPTVPPGSAARVGTGGTTPNRELMAEARQALAGQWGNAVLTTFLYIVVVCACQMVPFIGAFVGFFIGGPMMLGLYMFFLAMGRQDNPRLGLLFEGFRQFLNAFLAYLLMGIFVFLWALPGLALVGVAAVGVGVGMSRGRASGAALAFWKGPRGVVFAVCLVLGIVIALIPAIIAAYRYAMTFFVLAEDSAAGPLEAIRQSKQLMYGRKWKYFCLGLRFIGWALLCILTCGIGFLWLSPYTMTSRARFYDDLAPAEGDAGVSPRPV